MKLYSAYNNNSLKCTSHCGDLMSDESVEHVRLRRFTSDCPGRDEPPAQSFGHWYGCEIRCGTGRCVLPPRRLTRHSRYKRRHATGRIVPVSPCEAPPLSGRRQRSHVEGWTTIAGALVHSWTSRFETCWKSPWRSCWRSPSCFPFLSFARP